MGTNETSIIATPESQATAGASGNPLLLQIRPDRRLGHEWEDWNGAPLPNDGRFDERPAMFFTVFCLAGLSSTAVALGCLWLVGPRLASFWSPLPAALAVSVICVFLLSLAWLAAIGSVLVTGRNWLPGRLAERGLLPRVLPGLERLAAVLWMSRDRLGNSALKVFNRLAMARPPGAMAPEDLLILLPRCLSKESMQLALGVSARYRVPVFVAARGRYARQMIAMRRPKAVVAVACERDLVSGVGDVGGRLPVLGTTLQLGDGPCRNTSFSVSDLEAQVQSMLGLAGDDSPGPAGSPSEGS